MARGGADFTRALMEVLRAERDTQKRLMPELAAAAGVFEGTLRRYLNEYREMPVSVFYDLATALGVSPITLFERAERRIASEPGEVAPAAGSTLSFRDNATRPSAGEVGRRIALLVDVLARGRGSRHGYREISPLLLERGVRFSEKEWAELLEGDASTVPDDEALTQIAEVLGTEPAFLLGSADSADVVRIDSQLQFIREVQAGRVTGISARAVTDVTPETLRAMTEHLREEGPHQQ